VWRLLPDGRVGVDTAIALDMLRVFALPPGCQH
jgi:hypothetical protein